MKNGISDVFPDPWQRLQSQTWVATTGFFYFALYAVISSLESTKVRVAVHFNYEIHGEKILSGTFWILVVFC
jgi:hypothetical protein